MNRHPAVIPPDTLPEVADLFGSTALWALDDDVVHANHGSFGGITTATARAVAAARRRVAANPMRAFTRDFEAGHVAAVAAVAALVGARSADTALVPNATTGMDVAMRLLPWEPGATIVVADQAYPSVLANLRRRAQRTGTHLHVVATDPRDPAGSGRALVAAMDAAMDGAGGRAVGRTGVVVDQVASATACPFPAAEVVAAARARDMVVIVDGAHVPGQFAEGATRGADAWTGNLHKWACAPIALAALVVDERHHATIGPVVPTWLDGADFPANSTWQGTMDPGPMLVAEQVVAQAVAIRAHATRPRATPTHVTSTPAPRTDAARDASELPVVDRIEDLAVEGAAHLAAAVDGHVLPGRGWMRAVVLPPAILRAPMVATAMAGPAPAAGLASPLDLAARAVEAVAVAGGVETKVTPWQDELVLRLSCHAYTSERDHDRLADVLTTLVGTA